VSKAAKKKKSKKPRNGGTVKLNAKRKTKPRSNIGAATSALTFMTFS
jgi:hypothetical protein